MAPSFSTSVLFHPVCTDGILCTLIPADHQGLNVLQECERARLNPRQWPPAPRPRPGNFWLWQKCCYWAMCLFVVPGFTLRVGGQLRCLPGQRALGGGWLGAGCPGTLPCPPSHSQDHVCSLMGSKGTWEKWVFPAPRPSGR